MVVDYFPTFLSQVMVPAMLQKISNSSWKNGQGSYIFLDWQNSMIFPWFFQVF